MLQVGGQRQLLFWANTQLRGCLLGSGVQLLQLQQLLLLLLLPSQQKGQVGIGGRARVQAA